MTADTAVATSFRLTKSSRFEQKPHILIVLAVLWVIARVIIPSSYAQQFKAGDEVEVLQKATLYFNGKPFMDAKAGERLRVAVFRPNENRVYALRQNNGQTIAVSIDTGAVALVPLRQRAIEAGLAGRSNEAILFIQAARQVDPGSRELAEVEIVLREAASVSAQLDAAKAKDATVGAQAARIEKNAMVVDRPNLLIRGDDFNQRKAAAMREQATRLRETAAKGLASATEKSDETKARLKALAPVPSPPSRANGNVVATSNLPKFGSEAQNIAALERLSPQLKGRGLTAMAHARKHIEAGTNGGLDMWSDFSGIPIPTHADGTPVTTPTRDGVRFLAWKLGFTLAKGEKADPATLSKGSPEELKRKAEVEAILLGGMFDSLIDGEARTFLSSLPEGERKSVGESEFLRGFREGQEFKSASFFPDENAANALATQPAQPATSSAPPRSKEVRENATFPFTIQDVKKEVSAATHQPFVDGVSSVVFQFAEFRKFYDRRILVASKTVNGVTLSFFLNGDNTGDAVRAATLKSGLFTASESAEFMDLLDQIATKPNTKIGRFEVAASQSEYEYGKVIVFELRMPK